MDELVARLEAGERPGAVVRHAGPQLRHELALRWFNHRNEHLGRLVRELGLTAREPDEARVTSQLKAGRCQLAPGDAALLLRAFSDADEEVRQAAEAYLFSGLGGDWPDALGVAALSEWSSETRLKVEQAGFAPADPDLLQVFGWVAGPGTLPDEQALARITPRLTPEQRDVLASRLRKLGLGHLAVARPDVRVSLERLLQGRDGDALWAELTLGGSVDPLRDDELGQLVVPHPFPLERLAAFEAAELVAGDDFLIVPGQAILRLDNLQTIMELALEAPYAPPRALAISPRRAVLQPHWISLPDIPHLTREFIEPCRVIDLRDGSVLAVPLEGPLAGTGLGDRFFALQNPMVQCWELASGELRWSQEASWARELLTDGRWLVVLGKRHIQVWEAETAELVATLDLGGLAAMAGDVLAVEGPPGLRLFGLPELNELARLALPGCIGWSWRQDGCLLTATSGALQHWRGPDELQASWRQQRSGKLLAFHPLLSALVASDGQRLEYFHPGSEFPDQVVDAPGRPRFSPDGSRLLVGPQVFAVRPELELSRACPADMVRAAASPNRSARLVEALLRFRLRHEVLLDGLELFPPDAIEL